MYHCCWEPVFQFQPAYLLHFNTYQKHFFAQIENVSKLKDLTEETRPLILIGRFNKILEYNRSIYVDLHKYNIYSCRRFFLEGVLKEIFLMKGILNGC